MKSILIYYSLDGNTKAAAESIAKQLNCDITGIELVKDLPKSTFARLVVGGGQASFNKLPPIKPLDLNLEDYDLIILGTPIWAGKCASPVASFIDSCPVKERIQAVFTFSAGGDNDKCIANLKKKLPNLELTCALGDRRGKHAENNEKNTAIFVAKLFQYINDK